MTGSRFLRGVIAVAAAAAVGGAAAGAGGSSAGAPGRIFFSSNRAANLNPELIAIGENGGPRTQLTPPTGTFDQAAVSPDGTEVVGQTSNGLEVIDTDGTHARQLTPSWSDSFPSWSPDGKQVAYTAEVAEGGGGVFVVDAAGGTPVRLGSSALQLAPAWSPDGTRVAWVSWAGAPTLEVSAADGSSTTPVVAINGYYPSSVGWLSNATLVYDAGGSVRSVPAAGGTPVVLATEANHPVPSPDGQRIAFFAFGSNAVWVMNADGTGKAELLLSFSLAPISWSRDGQEIASANLIDGRQQVVAANADGTGGHRLTDEPPQTSISSIAGWTADGSKLLYTAQLMNNDRELYSMSPGGSGLRQLTNNPVDDSDPALSPDGRSIAFDRGAPDREALYLMRPDGTGVRQLTHSRFTGDREPSWSPDGTRIVFSSNRDTTGTYHLYLLDVATAKVTRLTKGRAQDRQPDWSGDGAWIAFTSTLYGDPGEGSQVWAVRPNGHGLHRLDAAATAFAPAWSPRGAYLAYTTTNPATGISSLVVQTASGADRQAVATGAAVSKPAWRPDGSLLLFSHGGGLSAAWPDGGAPAKPVDDAAGTTDEPAWQPLCTIRGTPGNDVIVGTRRADTICGFGGNDVIRGGGGNDTLIGGGGHDSLTGGAGHDFLFGGNGNDTLLGHDGSRDVLDGGPGRDRIQADRADTVR